MRDRVAEPQRSCVGSIVTGPCKKRKSGAPSTAMVHTDKGWATLQRAKSNQELFDKMTEPYSDWVADQSWLMFGFSR